MGHKLNCVCCDPVDFSCRAGSPYLGEAGGDPTFGVDFSSGGATTDAGGAFMDAPVDPVDPVGPVDPIYTDPVSSPAVPVVQQSTVSTYVAPEEPADTWPERIQQASTSTSQSSASQILTTKKPVPEPIITQEEDMSASLPRTENGELHWPNILAVIVPAVISVSAGYYGYKGKNKMLKITSGASGILAIAMYLHHFKGYWQ